MRILVLVLSLAREPWRTIERAGQRATWAAADLDSYLLRTKAACYVERRRLQATVAALPGTGLYGGFVGESEGCPFVSGTGMLLSRDVVEMAVADPDWEFDRVDDVALMRRVHDAFRALPEPAASAGSGTP